MIEQVTVAEAYKRGDQGWHYALYTAAGHMPVTVTAGNGFYWMHIIGATEPKAVDANTRLWALPIISEGHKP